MWQLWREIRNQGYTASDMSLRRLLSGWRSPAPQPGVAGTPLAPREGVIFYSTHKTRWLLLKAPEDLSEREAAYVTALRHLCPPIAQAQRLLTTFRPLFITRCEEGLDPWLEQLSTPTPK